MSSPALPRLPHDDVRRARRLPIGAELVAPATAHVRVRAPRRRTVHVVWETNEPRRQAPRLVRLEAEGNGYFSGTIDGAAPGDWYRFRLDDHPTLLPDPASRWQPDGPHGPSALVDPAAFRWTDTAWAGPALAGQVLYELHVGTFTPEGTWRAALAKLPLVADIGVTVIELMPVAEFPGTFGWGYDGVDLFAPTRLYGTPDDMRAFVDAAHRLGLGVILDVVYNHVGPEGNYLKEFADDYFTTRYTTEWGEALNFDGPGSDGMRELVLANVRYWIDEFHIDGLRLDATQCIFDQSSEHILSALRFEAHQAAGPRSTLVVAENEPQDVRLIRAPEEGGYGLDALWNDDFHHSAVVALTGRREAYYSDHLGAPQEFVSAAKYGFLYQGQWYTWQKKRRGTSSLDLDPMRLVTFIENHDQVANSARGLRLHQQTSPGRWRAMTTLLLLMPGTPMLFQGGEFAASARFVYFADHQPELTARVRRGRLEFLSQFPSISREEVSEHIADPGDPATFASCTLDWCERERHVEAVRLHRDLLELRRTDPVLSQQRRGGLDGAVLGPEAFVLRYFGGSQGDRLLLVNLGLEMPLESVPEPLFAPVQGQTWRLLFYSEHPRYGGSGSPPIPENGPWLLPGGSAVVLYSSPCTSADAS